MNKNFIEFDDKIISLEGIREIYLKKLYPGIRLVVRYEDGEATNWEANQYNDPTRDYEERIKQFYKELKRRFIDEKSN